VPAAVLTYFERIIIIEDSLLTERKCPKSASSARFDGSVSDRPRRSYREFKGRSEVLADAVIQNLLGYLKEHTDGAEPPENVIIFDEAQRAWDAEVGPELMGRPNSEPELSLKILRQLQWS
jgi:hypothetical protein